MRRVIAVLVAGLLLVSCGDEEGDEAELDPQERVERAENQLAEAERTFDEASTAFCDDSAAYIDAVDRYGRLFSEDEATVGDVRTAGDDLEAPRETVEASVAEVHEAREGVAEAHDELAAAQGALAESRTGTTPPVESTTTTTAALAPPATVERVQQAEDDLAAAFEGVEDTTLLTEAGEQVNAAAFALEVAWLRLIGDAGCLTDDEQSEALTAVTDYTAALQTSLAAAGYLDGEVDGIYGPETVAAVEALQTDNDLPATGLVDQATAEALQQAVAEAGGDAATEAVAHTAAVQSVLALAGYWTGPVDGQWSDALTAALQQLQTDLGVPATGTVDADTIAALQAALAEARADDPPASTPTPTATTEPS